MVYFDNHSNDNKKREFSKTSENSSWLSKLLNFSWREQGPVKGDLVNRVQRLQTLAQKRLAELQLEREKLQSAVDPELIPHVKMIVDPLIRKVEGIIRQKPEENSEAALGRLLERCQQWVSKVEQLIRTMHRSKKQPHEIKKTIVKHLFQMLQDRLSADRQTIRSYKQHRLDAITVLNDQDKAALSKALDQSLHKHLQSLKVIRKEIRDYRKRDDITIEEVMERQMEIDDRRSIYADAALHEVDRLLHEGDPEQIESMEFADSLLVNFRELADLEVAIPELLNRLSAGIKEAEFEHLQQELIDLEEDAVELGEVLDLTPELFDRFQVVLEELQKAHKLLFSKIRPLA